MADTDEVAYEKNCNDCKHSSAAGWSITCHNSKRPKEAVIARLQNTRALCVRATMPGCKHWEQGKACINIWKSPF